MQNSGKLAPTVAVELMRRMESTSPEDLAFCQGFPANPYSALLEIPRYDGPLSDSVVLSKLAGKPLKSPKSSKTSEVSWRHRSPAGFVRKYTASHKNSAGRLTRSSASARSRSHSPTTFCPSSEAIAMTSMRPV